MPPLISRTPDFSNQFSFSSKVREIGILLYPKIRKSSTIIIPPYRRTPYGNGPWQKKVFTVVSSARDWVDCGFFVFVFFSFYNHELKEQSEMILLYYLVVETIAIPIFLKKKESLCLLTTDVNFNGGDSKPINGCVGHSQTELLPIVKYTHVFRTYKFPCCNCT